VSAEIEKQMRVIAQGTALVYNVFVEVSYMREFVPLLNDAALRLGVGIVLGIGTMAVLRPIHCLAIADQPFLNADIVKNESMSGALHRFHCGFTVQSAKKPFSTARYPRDICQKAARHELSWGLTTQDRMRCR
jgi:hypothetical protein